MALENHAKDKPVTVLSGMALGVDQWAVEAALSIGLPFIAAVPFEGQEKTWPAPVQASYDAMLAKAEKVIVVSPGPYANWKFQVRNEWLVDNCNLLMAVWTGEPGGTANCVKYAERKKKPIERLTW